MRSRTSVLGALLVAGTVAIAFPAAAQDRRTTITIEPAVPLGPSNQHLVGFGWNTGGQLAPIADLAPTTIRIDGALQQLSRGPDDLDVTPLLAKQAEIRSIGAEPQVILSYMPRWLGEPNAAGRDPTRVAPSDLDAWERLIEDVVEAAATASAPAYRFEVWNEPDLPIFWQDTPAAFLETAVRTHRALATVADRTGLPLEIGGPAAFFPDAPFIAAYVERIREAGLPLDYVSWHYYGNYPFLGPDGAEGTIPEPLLPLYPVIGQENPATTPRLFSTGVELVRSTVATALAGSQLQPELVIDEWNLSAGGLDERHDTHVGAAFDAGVLIEVERASLDRADFYRARSSEPKGDWGTVALDGRRKPSWWTFHAWQATAGQRLAVEGEDPEAGLWARATAAGERTHVLLVNWVASGGRARDIILAVPGVCSAEVSNLDASSSDLASFTDLQVTDGAVDLQVSAQSLTWVRLSSVCVEPPASSAEDEPGGQATPGTGGGAAWLALALVLASLRLRASGQRRGSSSSGG